jgi:hypothetical protein
VVTPNKRDKLGHGSAGEIAVLSRAGFTTASSHLNTEEEPREEVADVD